MEDDWVRSLGGRSNIGRNETDRGQPPPLGVCVPYTWRFLFHASYTVATRSMLERVERTSNQEELDELLRTRLPNQTTMRDNIKLIYDQLRMRWSRVERSAQVRKHHDIVVRHQKESVIVVYLRCFVLLCTSGFSMVF